MAASDINDDFRHHRPALDGSYRSGELVSGMRAIGLFLSHERFSVKYDCNGFTFQPPD